MVIHSDNDRVVLLPTAHKAQQRWHAHVTCIFFIAAVCILLALRSRKNEAVPADFTSLEGGDVEVDWSGVMPSADIIWTPCLFDFQCARLVLPLDYLSPAGVGPNATIALLMLPATDRKNYKGTILVNPGGPGLSGTEFAALGGKPLSMVMGGEYDILGFDPRGTGASTPFAQCFDSESQSSIWKLRGGSHLINLDDGSVPLARAREKTVAQLCEKALGGTGKEEADGSVEEWGGGRFMSTASIATDMLKITEKLGQEKVQFLGFSYGSVLGQYFAAMYPDKVGRVVIDGVFDAYHYRAFNWNGNLRDTNTIFDAFYTLCHQAGADSCPLYEQSAQDIKNRTAAVIDRLRDEPISLPFLSEGPFVLGGEHIHQIMFSGSYFPTQWFPILATTLAAIEHNDLVALSGIPELLGLDFQCSCEKKPLWSIDNDAFYFIACADAEPRTYSAQAFSAAFAQLSADSALAAPIWANIFFQCTAARVRAKWRYTGPLEADTAHPLLLLSPRYDPVCPLADARAVHARFPGSALLVQESYGHCALWSGPSLCTAKHVRAYFRDGTLPAPGTLCAADELPFVGTIRTNESTPIEDVKVVEALKKLADATAAWA